MDFEIHTNSQNPKEIHIIGSFQACKSSLRTEKQQQLEQILPIDKAFGIMRELYFRKIEGKDPTPIRLYDVITECSKKGIDEEMTRACIETYKASGVIVVDPVEGLLFSMS